MTTTMAPAAPAETAATSTVTAAIRATVRATIAATAEILGAAIAAAVRARGVILSWVVVRRKILRSGGVGVGLALVGMGGI